MARPGLADPPGPSTDAERGGGGGGAEPDSRGWLAGRLRRGRAGAADPRPGERPGRRAHSRLQHGLPPRGPRGDQRVRSPVSQGRRRCGHLLAASARGTFDHVCAGAFVWHHRRQNPRSYLKQQAGYGEAEALLQFKHPDKFNGRGDGKWGGVMYGGSLQGLQVALPIIYRGTFGTGMFQCLYQPGAAHWAMLPSTFEWQVAALLLGLAGAIVRPLGWVLGAGYAGPVAAGRRPASGPGPHCAPPTGARCARLLIAALCYAQPLVRSWTRYRTRLSSQRAPGSRSVAAGWPAGSGCRGRAAGRWPTGRRRGSIVREILRRAVAFMDEHRWGKVLDTGWFEWDMAVYCDWGLILKVVTVQEEHGQGQATDPDPLSFGPDGQDEGHRSRSASSPSRSSPCPILGWRWPPRP